MLFKKSSAQNTKKAAVISAVAGGVVGAGLSAILAPKAGKKFVRDFLPARKASVPVSAAF